MAIFQVSQMQYFFLKIPCFYARSLIKYQRLKSLYIWVSIIISFEIKCQ